MEMPSENESDSEAESTGNSSMKDPLYTFCLPMEILAKIFGYAGGNTVMRMISDDELMPFTFIRTVLQRVRFSREHNVTWAEIADYLSSSLRRQAIEELDFSCFGSIGTELDKLFEKRFENLRVLDVSHSDATDKQIISIVENVKSLEEMTYSTFISRGSIHTAPMFLYREHRVLKIKKLTLDCLCNEVSNIYLKHHFHYLSFPNLEELCIRVRHLGIRAFVDFNQSTYQQLTLNRIDIKPVTFPSLSNFDIVMMDSHKYGIHLGHYHDDPPCIAEHFDHVVGESVRRRKPNHQVKTLHVSRNIILSEGSKLGEWIKSRGGSVLRNLKINGWNDAYIYLRYVREEMGSTVHDLLESLIEHCPNIRQLNLESYAINDIRIYQTLGKFEHLESLSIMICSSDINELVKNCPDLRELAIQNYTNSTCFEEQDYEFIAKLVNLRRLMISETIVAQNGRFLVTIATQCRFLQSLRFFSSNFVGGNFHVFWDNLQMALPQMTNLSEVVFHRKDLKLEEREFWVALGKVIKLRELCLASDVCYFVNVKWIQEFLVQAKHLEVIHIHTRAENYKEVENAILHSKKENNRIFECVVQNYPYNPEDMLLQHGGHFHYKMKLCYAESQIASGM